MVVGRQCFLDATIAHDNKRNAVRQRPSFVRMLQLEVEAALPEVVRRFYDRRTRIYLQCRDQSTTFRAMSRCSAIIGHFRRHVFRGDDTARPLLCGSLRFGVVRVPPNQQGDLEGRVSKSNIHCFGRP
jgi:hypothetical protein